MKVGSGAFMKTREQALQLAKSMEDVGREGGLETAVHVSDMDNPLGRAIGNGLEVAEAIETLQGEGQLT